MYTPDNQELQAVIISQDIIESVKELSLIVNDETLGVEVSPLSIYCQKTGAEIARRTENSIFSMVKIHGKDAVLRTLYYGISLNVHPAWIETDGDKMDILMEADPIGYACYCLNEITKGFYQHQRNSDPKRLPFAERYWALARANKLLQAKGVADLTELNLGLCRLLTFDAKEYLFKRLRSIAKTPDQLALLHCTGELTALLHECTNRALDSLGIADNYIKKTRFVDYALTPEDAARGPSNIRKQKASKANVKEATMYSELAKLFKDAGLDLEFKPSDGSWKKRYMSDDQKQQVEDTEAKMLADLAAFGGSNLLGLEDDNDDDNEVVVRTLAVDVSGLSSVPAILEPIEPIDLYIITNPVLGEIVEAAVYADMQNVSIQPVMVEIKKQIETQIAPAPNPPIILTPTQRASFSSLRDRYKKG